MPTLPEPTVTVHQSDVTGRWVVQIDTEFEPDGRLDVALNDFQVESQCMVPHREVLVVSHRLGLNVSLHPTRQAAVDDLHDYVCDQWGVEMGDVEMPDDQDAAIDRYFRGVKDEHYLIEQA